MSIYQAHVMNIRTKRLVRRNPNRKYDVYGDGEMDEPLNQWDSFHLLLEKN